MTARGRCRTGSTWASTSSRSARRRTRCRPMWSSARWSCSGVTSSLASISTPCTPPPATARQRRGSLLPPEFTELAARVSNWGRWGDADEIGTLNLIDAAARQRGAAAVKRGVAFSLALRLDQQGPQVGSIPGRINPLRTSVAINTQYMGTPDNFCCSDDIVTMGLQAATHWDALSHVSYSGQLYNGFPAASVTGEGASRCGIAGVESLTARGVLLDVARARGVDRLDPGYGITGEDLDAALLV